MADDDPTPRPQDQQWTRSDLRLGALFSLTGLLVTVYAWSAMRNEAPAFLWLSGWFVGPLMLLLGGNALWQALRAGQQGDDAGARRDR